MTAPVGSYVGAVALGYAEGQTRTTWMAAVTVTDGGTTVAPPLLLEPLDVPARCRPTWLPLCN
ncbi:MAG: hypothetical protein R2854_09340 [Caldilineaceae bacterium]